MTLIPANQLESKQNVNKIDVPGLAHPLLLSPSTIMGDRGSEYKAVAKDELEALEMTVSGEKDLFRNNNAHLGK